jgi:hypothetical protein
MATVSDQTGRSQHVRKIHVGRNTDAMVAELSALIGAGQASSLSISSRFTKRGTITVLHVVAAPFTDQAPGAKKMSIEENGSEMISGRR